MKVKKAIKDILTADVPVVSLVGLKIYGGPAQWKATRPFIVFEILTADQMHHLNGPSDLVKHTVVIRCVDDEDENAWIIADAVRTALDGIPKPANPSNWDINGIEVPLIRFQTEEDEFVVETDGEEIPAYVATQTYDVWTRR